MADLTDKQIAIGNGSPTPEMGIYVACHQCDNCGHIGINDAVATEDGMCRRCGWRGPYPQDDACPDCGSGSGIEDICPQCHGCYVLLAEDHIEAPPGVKEPPALPTTEELESLWETTHYGHPADFGADVLERWGGWMPGLLGHGGALQEAVKLQAQRNAGVDARQPQQGEERQP